MLLSTPLSYTYDFADLLDKAVPKDNCIVNDVEAPNAEQAKIAKNARSYKCQLPLATNSKEVPHMSGDSFNSVHASGSQYSVPPIATGYSALASLTSLEWDLNFVSWNTPPMDDMTVMHADMNVPSTVAAVTPLQPYSFTPQPFHQQFSDQLTPTDDFSPKMQAVPEGHETKGDVDDGDAENGNTSTDTSAAPATRSSRRRLPKSRSKSSSDPPCARGRPRKSRRVAESQTSPADPAEDEKRERFLERNRIAATKCRQKKQKWTDNLEEDEQRQKALNTYLKQCVAQMREELLFLKGQCLRHSDCACEAIRSHMASTIPKMQRPSPALYNDAEAINVDTKSSPSCSSGYQSWKGDKLAKDRRDSALSGTLSDDDDMREVFSATMLGDALEC